MRHSLKENIKEFLLFGIIQARACIFAGSFFTLLFLSNYIPLGALPRYDFLFIAAILIQIILAATKVETKYEVKVIFLFHIIGLVLEIFKTQSWIGSWSYPEFGYLKILGVPLYSGFMYAAIGSYVSQSWKLQKMSMPGFPKYSYAVILSALIYINFFTHHFIPDFRIPLAIAVVILFWKTKVVYTIKHTHQMPLVLAFGLIAFFIWIAENIASYLGAWKYPYQLHAWSLVSFQKFGSWSLMVIISIIIVAYLKHYKESTKPLDKKGIIT